MGIVEEGVLLTANFLYGQPMPRSWEMPILLIFLYVAHLFISSAVLYISVNLAGGKVGIITGFARSLLTVFIRDLIAIPLITITFFFPFSGIAVALLVWLALIKYIFTLTWTRTVLVFIISLLLPVIIALFILIPMAIVLLF